MNTLSIVLYLLGQVIGLCNLLERPFVHSQLRIQVRGEGKDLRSIPQTQSLLSAASCQSTYAQFVFSGLLTYFLTSLGVQSSPVQSNPLHSMIIETFCVLSTLYFRLNKCCINSMADGDLCQWRPVFAVRQLPMEVYLLLVPHVQPTPCCFQYCRFLQLRHQYPIEQWYMGRENSSRLGSDKDYTQNGLNIAIIGT